jgi:hypothetical protein
VGLAIRLVNFKGDTLGEAGDPKNYLHRLLPREENVHTFLAAIDWYGDTYFNYLQIGQFLKEWDEMAKGARLPEEKALIAEVRELAVRCESERELLRFIGD